MSISSSAQATSTRLTHTAHLVSLIPLCDRVGFLGATNPYAHCTYEEESLESCCPAQSREIASLAQRWLSLAKVVKKVPEEGDVVVFSTLVRYHVRGALCANSFVYLFGSRLGCPQPPISGTSVLWVLSGTNLCV